jgi:hypothetical protein
MMDFPDDMTIVVVLFFVVFALNIVPAFAPPTWVTLSFVGLTVPSVNVVALAVVGATAATLGRVVLAKLSRLIVRRNFLSEQARLNVDALKQGIEGKKALTSTMFVAFALSPLPSNLKLTRFRGHPKICVEGVHDAKQGKEASTIPA